MTEPTSFPREERNEGSVARSIERQTAKLPSDLFLWTAIGSMGISAMFQIMAKRNRSLRERSLFVGQWAAPLLILGLYNKVVKITGVDRR